MGSFLLLPSPISSYPGDFTPVEKYLDIKLFPSGDCPIYVIHGRSKGVYINWSGQMCQVKCVSVQIVMSGQMSGQFLGQISGQISGQILGQMFGQKSGQMSGQIFDMIFLRKYLIRGKDLAY